MSDKKTVNICCGTGCLAKGSMEVYEEMKAQIAKLGANAEVNVKLKATGCDGLCEKGPVLKIYPDDIAYFKVKVEDVEDVVKKTLMNGEIIEKLLYFETATKQRLRNHKESEFCKRQYKIALRNVGEIDPISLEDYVERGGYKALKKAISSMKPEDVLEEITKSGLRGRGGAGFPTGRKWKTAADIDTSPIYVVCNGDEGDPGAFMDRSIMEGDPNSVIEGMTLCAYAVGGTNGFAYIRDEYGLAVENMQKAINKAKDENLLGNNILGTDFSFDIQIVRGGGAFVCGESTALMSSIEGMVGEPRAKYIHTTEKGLWGQPTVLNNVETWANVPIIIEKGGDWYHAIGTMEKSKGTKVFSLVGKVKNTGLVEVPMGTTLREIIYDIGGGVLNDRKFKAVQIGGPSGGCLPAEYLDLPVDYDTLVKADSMMGSGGMIVMDDRTCMVDVTRYYLSFLAEESCGKCVPCREGVKRMLEILTDICNGDGKEGDIEELLEICSMTSKASLCSLGKSAPNPVIASIRYFRDEFEEHIKNKRCRAGVCKKLTTFGIDEDKCKGCDMCKKNCPADCITGEIKKPHTIDADKCLRCGNCMNICKFDAVKVL
ncbi:MULTISPECIES: NADH-ubiquinone oxidoreductase-F iron-sulfur binding region domain-containing protein [Clostridium]|uniref:NADH dehydrogenase I, F subunit n=4 Tax=Clostridium TaxID=1485 RepID=D8GNS8_CLOLD|nr:MULTISPECIES: NADH-ubiquinone oxidoreductase-F iron-sulfur binding region domain-containing protein [Clostridium]ADK13774.1 NADH dehydrogenase I, F subunit [Clostridium ljungdahlii DSM 13528]AGT29710.1 electron bifurcating FeFe-hydrogenase dependent on TPN subunit B [Clostridium autoethanogenum DSM 10061]AGY77002.1 SLBB domain-containing protein [Clostridium autoethanogenum DSM 10061]ALU37145.1 NADH dehydrogenase (quinone) [Clostridium autoethanogenum DSM 10061]OAA85022.1 NADP-reducing hydr